MTMRNFLFFLAAFTFTQSLYSTEKKEESFWDYHPLHIGGNLIRMGKANVTPRKGGNFDPLTQGGHLHFRKSNAFLYMLVPISQTSYFFPRVEWNTFTLDWSKNTKFRETHFYYLQFALTFYSTGLENWRWIARTEYNIDQEHMAHPGSYSLFSFFLWGAHQIHRKWHYHIGALGYKGMEGQEVYPLIGLDYAPNKKWLFQAIFPINYSIEYSLGKNWRFSLKGRPLKERFRVGYKELAPRSVFSYSTMGSEFNIHYERFLRLEIEAYVGYSFGGSFYIKNQAGKNALYTDVGSAPYGGLNLNYGF